jgi:hypothetical protein
LMPDRSLTFPIARHDLSFRPDNMLSLVHKAVGRRVAQLREAIGYVYVTMVLRVAKASKRVQVQVAPGCPH